MLHALMGPIDRRYACREFIAGRPLSGDEMAVLLEAARRAPSAFGLEPWRFIVVTDAAAREAVARACFGQPPAATAAALVVVVALVAALEPGSEYVRARLAAEARGQDSAPIHAAYRAFYQATPIAAWAQGECNFAAAHILLQAADMGLGSCPIGGFDADALASAVGIQAGEVPALVIALGHCSHAAPVRFRKPLD